MLKTLSIILLSFILVGCAGKAKFDVRTQQVSYKDLSTITAPKGDPIIIAVYDFLDMTGQKKPGGSFASMSTAVTQGSYQILIKSLQDAGNGEWFRVVERSSLASLLQERKLIRTTRQLSEGENAEPLPALLFAGAYITGGIIGYDSDIKSGGFGARVLGIQANKQYRQDIVTIILRLINVQTGEVVISTTVEKTIFSTSTGSDIFKYFDTDTMLVEVEAGFARNEPVTLAVRKAIEKGVVDLIHLGAKKELWEFDVEEIEIPEIKDYMPSETKVHADIETKAEEVTNENNDENVDTSNESATN
jgi:curli production assembly/transport component CsgG|tara:strand:+ start:753 stop:1664 length:912 start_codon:yes stop_codon:yes gene_type:complete